MPVRFVPGKCPNGRPGNSDTPWPLQYIRRPFGSQRRCGSGTQRRPLRRTSRALLVMIGVRPGHQAARSDAVAFGEFADITKSGGTRRTPRAAIHPRRLNLPAGSFPRPPGECGPGPGALPPRSPARPCGGQNTPEWLPTLVRKALGWRQCDATSWSSRARPWQPTVQLTRSGGAVLWVSVRSVRAPGDLRGPAPAAHWWSAAANSSGLAPPKTASICEGFLVTVRSARL
jgi:hypothetical protein